MLVQVMETEGVRHGVLLAAAARDPVDPFDLMLALVDRTRFGVPAP
jgi:hypothetical protein